MRFRFYPLLVAASALTSVLVSPAHAQVVQSGDKPADAAGEKAAAVASTKLGGFLARKGVLIFKDFNDLGTMQKRESGLLATNTLSVMNVQAITSWETTKPDDKYRGFIFTVTQNANGYGYTNTAYVDQDQAQALSDALQYMIDFFKDVKGKRIGSKQIQFTTKGDFQVNFTQNDVGKDQFGTVICGTVNPVAHYLGEFDLKKLKEMVDAGIVWLKAH